MAGEDSGGPLAVAAAGRGYRDRFAPRLPAPILDRRAFVMNNHTAPRYLKGARVFSKNVLVLILLLSVVSSSTLLVGVHLAGHVAYTPHPSITINGNADFAAQALANSWPGSGLLLDPYVISGYEISRITISNTNCHFEIRDCHIANPDYSAAIGLYTVTNGMIVNNSMQSYVQIALTDCSGNWILNNTFSPNPSTGYTSECVGLTRSPSNVIQFNDFSQTTYGVLADSSDGTLVSNNTFWDLGGYPIYLVSGSDWCRLLNNSCVNSSSGICVWESDYVEISGNSFAMVAFDGIALYYSEGARLRNNLMVQTGVDITGNTVTEYDSHDIDTSNKVNGRSVYYFANEVGSLPVIEAGQLIFADCRNMAVTGQNVSEADWGVQVYYSTSISVSDCLAFRNYYGVCAYMSDRCSFVGINCSGCYYAGIAVYDCLEPIVQGCNCSGSPSGIEIQSVDNGVLEWNDCEDCDHGILAYEASGNLIQYNNLGHCRNGLYAVEGNFNSNTISHNNLTGTLEEGIWIQYSSDNTIDANLVSDAYWGIDIEYCYGTVCRNNIMENTGFYLYGDELDHWVTTDIDGTNTVNGLPAFFAAGQVGLTVPSGQGQILLAGCDEAVISDVSISNCSVAVELGFCSDVLVNNSNLSDCPLGIDMFACDSCNMTNCTLVGNWYGAYLEYCDNGTMANNTVADSDGHGLWYYASENNTLCGNEFSNNSGYGVYLVECKNCLIWNNSFQANNGAGAVFDPYNVQAYDDSGLNAWNTSVPPGLYHGYGNYWSDWTSPDANGDYIVDIPYDVGGPAEDMFPLTDRWVPPVQIPDLPLVPVALALGLVVCALGARRARGSRRLTS